MIRGWRQPILSQDQLAESLNEEVIRVGDSPKLQAVGKHMFFVGLDISSSPTLWRVGTCPICPGIPKNTVLAQSVL